MKQSKKALSVFLAFILFFSVSCSVYAGENTDEYYTPPSSALTKLLWAEKFGRTYRDAPSEPIVCEDTLVIMSGNRLLKLSKTDGSTVAETQMGGAIGYSCIAPTYANGMIFCQLDNAVIEAFDSDTLQKLWAYQDPLGGQSLTNIVYDENKVYTGFWNDEDETASFVCLDASNGEKLWNVEKKGGFYWAECAVVGDYVVFGSDDGTIYDNRESEAFLVNKNSGEIADTMSAIGDIRSGVTFCNENGRIYFTTKAGYIYSAKIENGKFTDVKETALDGASTSTPSVVTGRVYVGVQGSNLKGSICILDADSLQILYSVETRGYPQNHPLVSSAYGVNYVYFTYNSNSGGIAYFIDSPEQTSASAVDLFIPEQTQAGYCLSALTYDGGNIYYKNDAGYIFAVGQSFNGKMFMEQLKNFLIKIFTLIESLCKIFV